MPTLVDILIFFVVKPNINHDANSIGFLLQRFDYEYVNFNIHIVSLILMIIDFVKFKTDELIMYRPKF